MARIQVRVSDEQKSLWDEYAANNPEFQSTADLVRTVVTREIKGWDGSGSSGVDDETSGKIDEIDDQLGDLLAQMRVMTQALSASPIMSDDSDAIQDFDVSALPDNPDDAYHPDKVTIRRKLREISENIANIRETDDGGFYKGNEQ